jgi:hypothetical protein
VQCAGRREVTPTLECARRHQEPVRFGIAEAEAPRQMALF